MGEVASVADDVVRQAARLRQFLRWVIMCGVVGSVELLGYALTRTLPLGLTSGLTLSFVGLACWTWMLVRRGALSAAVIFLCAGFLGVAGGIVFILPAVLPGIVAASLLVVVLGLPYLGHRALRGLIIGAGLMGVVATVLAQLPIVQQLFSPPPPLISATLIVTAVAVVLGLTLLLLWQFSTRLHETLAEAQAANAALRASQVDLAAQVAARTADLYAALTEVEQQRAAEQVHLLTQVEQQRAIIRELGTPIIPISRHTAIMPLVGAVDSQRLGQIQTQALQAIERTTICTLILDITGVPVLEPLVAQELVAIVQAARLLGTEVLLVGILPEVAQAIVGLGVSLPGLRTYVDLQSALSRPFPNANEKDAGYSNGFILKGTTPNRP